LAGVRAGRAGKRLCEALFARLLDREFSAPDALRVDTVFYGSGDLGGLIWEAVDQWDHPLLAYETKRDFRNCQLSFHWRSSGIRALDLVNGPTLTIEGRDASGNPRSWYVRLWNYASGTPTDATIALDFKALNGGSCCPPRPIRSGRGMWTGCSSRSFRRDMTPGARNIRQIRRAGSS